MRFLIWLLGVRPVRLEAHPDSPKSMRAHRLLHMATGVLSFINLKPVRVVEDSVADADYVDIIIMIISSSSVARTSLSRSSV